MVKTHFFIKLETKNSSILALFVYFSWALPSIHSSLQRCQVYTMVLGRQLCSPRSHEVTLALGAIPRDPGEGRASPKLRQTNRWELWEFELLGSKVESPTQDTSSLDMIQSSLSEENSVLRVFVKNCSVEIVQHHRYLKAKLVLR